MIREVAGYDGDNGEQPGYRLLHSMGDVCETSLTLDRITNLDGTVPFDTNTLSFYEDDIVQTDSFLYDDPDYEDYDAYDG
jgi:hypothetical protein